MKKVIYFLAAWFLLEWFFTTKLKPFIIHEFGGGTQKDSLQTGPVIDSADTGSKVYGIDISRWQKHYEMTAVLNYFGDTLKFVIAKATDGMTPDLTFIEHWDTIGKRKMIRGAYHFYRCDDGAVNQAQNYFQVLKSVGFSNNDLPPIIDFESNPSASSSVNKTCLNSGTIANTYDSILSFLAATAVLTGRQPMVYINRYTGEIFAPFKNRSFNGKKLSDYPLWIAEYGKIISPHVPVALNPDWMFWQMGKTVPIKGDTLDLDKFHGSMDDLKAFIKSGAMQ